MAMSVCLVVHVFILERLISHVDHTLNRLGGTWGMKQTFADMDKAELSSQPRVGRALLPKGKCSHRVTGTFWFRTEKNQANTDIPLTQVRGNSRNFYTNFNGGSFRIEKGKLVFSLFAARPRSTRT
jgi:hypothetical protein